MRTWTVFCVATVGLNAVNVLQAAIYSSAPISLDQIGHSVLLMMPVSLMIAAVHHGYRKRAARRRGTQDRPS